MWQRVQTKSHSDAIRIGADLYRYRFRHMQIQTDSDRFRQVQSTESHKYRDEREADRQINSGFRADS
ncbi:hypothetical protein Tco_0766192 [Tanacetum coccineum]